MIEEIIENLLAGLRKKNLIDIEILKVTIGLKLT